MIISSVTELSAVKSAHWCAFTFLSKFVCTFVCIYILSKFDILHYGLLLLGLPTFISENSGQILFT